MGAKSKFVGWAGAAACVMASAVVVPSDAGAAPAAAGHLQRATSGTALRVGSFNVRSVKYDVEASPGEQPWRQRRVAVIRDILQERPDVLGVQETSQNPMWAKHLVDGSNQYLDLRNGLNKAGGHFQLTNTDVKASRTTRILYDTTAVRMIRQGTYRYAHQSTRPNETRYMVWAVFEDTTSHHRFFFANTHLTTASGALERAEWHELIDRVNALKGDLPVVVVGDFQKSKLRSPASDMMTKMKAAGYGDVVGQQPLTIALDHPRARHLSHAWINTVNRFNRNVADYSWEDKRDKAGQNCDWIFASNYLTVKKWKVVVHMDPRTLQLTGVIPSDHNMVRATLVLP